MSVHTLPSLALAQVRVANGLADLEEWERLSVLRHAVVHELLRCPDVRAEMEKFFADLQAELAFIFSGASTKPTTLE